MNELTRSAVMSSRRRTQRGAAVMVEFVLASLMLTPLALGTIAVGLGLTRYMQVGSVCRSSASLFVRGVDFSQTGAQRLLGKLADGLGMTDSNGNVLTNGNGVMIFSLIQRVGDADCLGGGYAANDSRCTNRYKAVVIRRIVVGNQNLRSSRYATPVGGSPSADGSYPASFYLVNSSAAASAFGTAPDNNGVVSGAPVHLASGEVTYLAEAFFRAPEINLFPAVLNMPGFYQKNFF